MFYLNRRNEVSAKSTKFLDENQGRHYSFQNATYPRSPS